MPNFLNKRHTLLSHLGLGVALSTFALTGCAVESASDDLGEVDEAVIVGNINAEINNGTGRHRILQNGQGTVNLTGSAFARAFPGNGRACVDCHQPAQAMGISAAQTQQIFDQTQGLDPVFRLFDGANGPTAPVATLDQRRAAYSALRTNGLIRIPFNLRADRDYDVRIVLNPYPNVGANPVQNTSIPAGSTQELSVYRRPLLSANTRFISAVMWDGREAAAANPVAAAPGSNQLVRADNPNAPVFRNMLVQSNNATRGHAEATRDLTAAERDEIVRFQMGLVVAQVFDNQAGSLSQNGQSPAQALLNQQTFFGINDSHGGSPVPGATFNPNAMTVFGSAFTTGVSGSQLSRRQSILRGQQLFNTRLIRISGVRGVNDALGVATLNGSCTTCHSHPNVGNHPDILPLDLGVSDVAHSDNVHPVFAITSRATGQRIETTDPGRAFVTGRFADLNKQKGPTLRALSSRAPYFHGGSADSLDEVITFYDARFGMGLQAQEKADLKAFLEAL